MRKVFRPFWSYDVKKTENWLSSMAASGYHLVDFNRWTRNFFFLQGDPKRFTYRIGYGKPEKHLPYPLLMENWSEVAQSGNWSFLLNEKPPGEIKTFPVRDGIIKHNRIIQFIFFGVFIYFTVCALFNLAIIGFVLFMGEPIEVEQSPMWIFTFLMFGIAIGVYMLCIYTILKIRKSNQELNGEKQTKFHRERFSKEKEKQLKRSGQLVVKRKLGWIYAPDKLEKWLETKEELGYHLYRVGKTGTAFYFIQGTPRKVRYCAHYQNFSDESYFDFLRETGWNDVYSSYFSIQKWTIWSREYMEGEEPPQIYSDRNHLIKHARRVAIGYTTMFLPLVLMYSFNIGLSLRNMNSSDNERPNMVLFILCLLVFGLPIVRIWLYYMRLRKQDDLPT